MIMANKNELVPQGNFQLVSMYDGMDEDMQAEMLDEMEDLGDAGIDYRTIKMPSGKVKFTAVSSPAGKHTRVRPSRV